MRKDNLSENDTPQFHFQKYDATSRPIGNHAEADSHIDLEPLTQDDMMRAAHPDFDLNVYYSKIVDMEDIPNLQCIGNDGKMQQLDRKSFKIGVRPQLSDEELKKFMGLA